MDLIPIQASHVTQHTTGHLKSPWLVKLNSSEVEIAQFPSTYSESEVFYIMDFVRKYELEALNIGITYQKGKTNGALASIIEQQKQLILTLKDENEKLSTLAERLMIASEI